MNSKTALLLLLGLSLLSFTPQSDFLTEQKRYLRVRTAINEKQHILESKLAEQQLALDNFHLLFVVYKDSDLMDVYTKSKQDTRYRKILSYNICFRSGRLGPKRKQGDRQVPEGFYHICRFNPASNYYLSLGINYPNLADRRKSETEKLGGDIFIHGSCVSIGCLPMTDDYIKEIYLLAAHARNNGQHKIPVYIFPFEMTKENFASYQQRYNNDVELIDFWRNLRKGYDEFMKDKEELRIRVNDGGDYRFTK